MIENQIEEALNKRMNGDKEKTEKFRQNVGGKDQSFKSLNETMIEHIKRALKKCRGKIHGPGGAAELLDIHPSTLRKRMDKFEISYGYKH